MGAARLGWTAEQARWRTEQAREPLASPSLDRAGRSSHQHLWFLADGTPLHAPPGALRLDHDGERVCCHLCGRWFRSLGLHLRSHGITADDYRQAMGLSKRRPLHGRALAAALSERATFRYEHEPDVRRHFSHGQALARSGQLQAMSNAARQQDRPETVALRRAALERGRQRQRLRRASERMRATDRLGGPEASAVLSRSYAAGASLESLAQSSGLGRRAVQSILTNTGTELRQPGRNTPAGKRSRAMTADARAAKRVGTDDLTAWLQHRRDLGWTLDRLGAAVGHSGHWVRWRLHPTRLPAQGSRTTSQTADTLIPDRDRETGRPRAAGS